MKLTIAIEETPIGRVLPVIRDDRGEVLPNVRDIDFRAGGIEGPAEVIITLVVDDERVRLVPMPAPKG